METLNGILSVLAWWLVIGIAVVGLMYAFLGGRHDRSDD